MRPGQLKLLIMLAAVLSLPLYLSPVRGEPQQPGQNAAAVDQEQEYSEEEYDAYEKAKDEKDPAKKADALIAFMEKYPKSKLQQYIVAEYQNLAYGFRTNKQYDMLLGLSERWLKFFPEDLQTWAYALESATQLGNTQKRLEYAQKIYALKPTGALALEISETYKKAGNEASCLEWLHKVMEYPEYAGDFKLRLDLAQKYASEKNLTKAAEYAQLTLKSLDAAKKPEGMSDAEWQKAVRAVRRASHWLRGLNYYETKKYPQAVEAFQEALKAEVFDAAFYYIGLSQWKMDQIDEATISFGAAELLKGEHQSQAKDHLEKLYKALHNNTTVGIDKVYKKAQALLDATRAAARG